MKKIKLMIPKGRIFDKVVKLLNEAGVTLESDERAYRPVTNDSSIEVKMMKPQNIPKLIELGAHDIGFTGYDWILESNAKVEEIIDLKFDPVKIVCAIPKNLSINELKKKQIVVASEYENLSKRYLDKNKFKYVFLRTYGATEVFPPDDADMIIDNTSTGRTLEANNLKIIDTLINSSTRFIANKNALKDPYKFERIKEFEMLFRSILDARDRVMLEMNVPKEKFEEIISLLPCMRSPTVSPLYGEGGYAVKVAVKESDAVKLIPKLIKHGATDILEYKFRKVVI
ncbi:MAG TPA: ATP phosphoribosyltransferase [Ignavibacteria bacterium]